MTSSPTNSDLAEPSKAYIFECTSNTYLDCVGGNVFGSNKPLPLEIKAGDYCLLHHYEIGGLLGLWPPTWASIPPSDASTTASMKTWPMT